MLALALAWVATTPDAAIRAAVGRALPPLVAGAEGHVEKRSCFACHNQTFPLLAFDAARSRGFAVADEVFETQADHTLAFLAENRDKFRSGAGTGGQVDTAGSALWALELTGAEADENTEAVAEYLLKTQPKNAHWRTTSNRPPTEASHFTATYLAVRGLKAWGTDDQQERIDRRVTTARKWLVATPAVDTEDRVFRLLALAAADAGKAEVSAAAWELLAAQRADGGWGQLDRMPSDPYATATALVALHRAGGLRTDHPAYRRGVAALLGWQLPDGTWRVRSRSKPFQPYYETGFPHGADQFLSSAASGWAATALALALPAKE